MARPDETGESHERPLTGPYPTEIRDQPYHRAPPAFPYAASGGRMAARRQPSGNVPMWR